MTALTFAGFGSFDRMAYAYKKYDWYLILMCDGSYDPAMVDGPPDPAWGYVYYRMWLSQARHFTMHVFDGNEEKVVKMRKYQEGADCPKCKSKAGYPCRFPNGQEAPDGFVHNERAIEWETQNDPNRVCSEM